MSGQVLGRATRMALPTAAIHLLLGFAFLTVVTDRGWAAIFSSPLVGGRIARTWMPLFIVVMGMISFGAQWVEDSFKGSHLGHQIGMSASVVAVASAALILAARSDRLDQERLREAAHAVRRSGRLYELGFEGSPVGVVIADQGGTVINANRAFAALVGRSASAMAGRDSVWTLSDPEHLSGNLDVLQSLFSGTRNDASFETAIVASDGRSIPVRVDLVRVEIDDEPVLFAFASDLTDIREANRQLESKNSELAYLAERDPLTGVLNRRGFLDHVQSALDDGADSRQPSAVLFIDIDGFKTVNDVYGHRVGDRFLWAIADKLVQNTAADGGQVGRLGGDEFAVLLTDCGPAVVADIARGLQRCVREVVVVEGVTLTASCSIGYAIADEWASDCEEFLARADQDMYASRRARQAGLAQRVDELREAIESEQLTIHFQPIWTLAAGGPELHGYEALVRWQHPERGLVPPIEFIGTAEEGGLIRRLDLWVAHDALERMSANPGLSLALNFSALSLAVPGTSTELVAAIRAAHRDPQSVLVELTESVDIPDSSQIINSLTELRQAGVQIALDDFGAGYAGLNNLRNLPIDVVKIDRSLIATLATESEQADNTEHFLGGIRQLTRAMGTEVLAEGIETERQLTIVKRLGFDFVQGYLLGPPVPGTSLEAGAASRK